METVIREKLTRLCIACGITEGYQHEAIFDEERDVVYNKARAIGLSSAFSLRMLLRAVLPKYWKKPQKESVIVSASDRQAKHLLKDYIRMYWEKIKNKVKANLKEDSEEAIGFDNGYKIVCIPCNPDAIRSWHGDVYFDEFAWWMPKKARESWAASTGVVSLGGARRIWSTPAEEDGEFYETWAKDKTFKKVLLPWTVVTRTEYRMFVEKERESMKARGISEDWEQEYNCEFSSGSERAIPPEAIEACLELGGGYQAMELYTTENNIYGGSDFAKEIDESYNISLEKLGEFKYKIYFIQNFKFKTDDYDIQLQYLNNFVEQIPTLVAWNYDMTGVGVKLAEDLKNPVFHGISFTNPVKERMFTKVKFAIIDHQIILPDHDGLIRSLRKMKKKVTDSGNTQYMGKRDDAFWALALALDAAREQTVTPLDYRVLPSQVRGDMRTITSNLGAISRDDTPNWRRGAFK